jgi:hypothetical protein
MLLVIILLNNNNMNISSKKITKRISSNENGITNIKVVIPKNVERPLFFHKKYSRILNIKMITRTSFQNPKASTTPIVVNIPLPPLKP